MNKWPCNCAFPQYCYHVSLNDADTMAGPDMPLAPSGEPWFIIHFVLTDPFLSSLSRFVSEDQTRMKLKPSKKDSPWGSYSNKWSPWSHWPHVRMIYGWRPPALKSQSSTAEQFHIGRRKQMLLGNCWVSTALMFRSYAQFSQSYLPITRKITYHNLT